MPRKTSDWESLAIPKATFNKIKEILAFVGYTSVSEYVRAAVNRRLEIDLLKYEEFQEHLEELREKKKEMIE